MSSNSKFFDLKKKKDGSLVVIINFNLINVFKTFFNGLFNVVRWLDNLARFSFLMMFIGSIGLGFGMGVIVFSQPDVTKADNSFSSDQEVGPQQLWWMDDLYQIENKADPIISLSSNTQVFWQAEYGSLMKDQNIVIYSHELPFFEQTALGTQTKLVGENGGIYTYAVTQIQIIDRKDLSNMVQSNTNSLIIYQSDDLFATQLLVVMARLQS